MRKSKKHFKISDMQFLTRGDNRVKRKITPKPHENINLIMAEPCTEIYLTKKNMKSQF